MFSGVAFESFCKAPESRCSAGDKTEKTSKIGHLHLLLCCPLPLQEGLWVYYLIHTTVWPECKELFWIRSITFLFSNCSCAVFNSSLTHRNLTTKASHDMSDKTPLIIFLPAKLL